MTESSLDIPADGRTNHPRQAVLKAVRPSSPMGRVLFGFKLQERRHQKKGLDEMGLVVQDFVQ